MKVRKALFLSCLISICAIRSLSAQEGAIQHVHDPCIIKAKNAYYIFSTGRGIPIHRSQDLFHWETAGKVFDNLPDWATKAVRGANFPWAPDISFFNGEYHLYYAISTSHGNRSCIGLATNKTLDQSSTEYRWVDRGKVIETDVGRDTWNAIDPNIILDQKHRPWLVAGSARSGIKMFSVDVRTGKPENPRPKLFTLAARPEGETIEAPFVVWKDGYYYLFVSFDACCKGTASTYKIMVGRSEDVTGPYQDQCGRPLTDGGGTLILAGYRHIRGPGHNAVLMDGERSWIVHHFYDANSDGVPTLQIRPLVWGDDGWPLAGEPITGVDKVGNKVVRDQLIGTWRHSVDFGPEKDLLFQEDSKIGKGPARWSFDGTMLILRWPRKDAPGRAWIDKCVVSPDGQWYTGRNQQGKLIRGVRKN